MLCSTRFVVDVAENSEKKEAWWPTCAAPRLGYDQSQKATCSCSYLGHQNQVTFFVGRIFERRPTNTTHHPPRFQCESTVSYTHLTLPTILLV